MRIADGARFHLRSPHRILSALFPGQPAFLLAFDDLLRRLEFGLPQEALGLMALPVPLNRGQYLALFAVGARSPEMTKALGVETLENCVGTAAAERIGVLQTERELSA